MLSNPVVLEYGNTNDTADDVPHRPENFLAYDQTYPDDYLRPDIASLSPETVNLLRRHFITCESPELSKDHSQINSGPVVARAESASRG